MTTLQDVRDAINKTYDKAFTISHANELFKRLSSTRKETIIRSLYLNDLTVRRMWEREGMLHWEIISSKHHKYLELAKAMDKIPDVSGMETYEVLVDKKLKWHCHCYWFGKCQNLDECTHILQIKLTNILREYINYFIYAYRFLLPDMSYRKFIIEFRSNN